MGNQKQTYLSETTRAKTLIFGMLKIYVRGEGEE